MTTGKSGQLNYQLAPASAPAAIQDILQVAATIRSARRGLSHLDSREIRRAGLPQASEELHAVMREMRGAVHTIIDQAESMLAFNADNPEAYKAQVDATLMTIIAACGFEDLAGQRMTKAATRLLEIEERLVRHADALLESERLNPEASLTEGFEDTQLDGPAIDAPHMSQAEIDAAFSA